MPTARDHTRTIVEHAGAAHDRLAYFNGRIRNGHGELSDPSYAWGLLRDARRDIDKALVALGDGDRIGWNKSDD